LDKKNLIIIGAGNVGGFIAYNPGLFSEQYNLLGFLDDDVNKTGKTFYGHKVLGNVEQLFSFSEKPAIVIGIAAPKIKKVIHEKLKDKGFSFPSFISKNAWLSNQVSVGEGVIIYPGVAVNYETVVEDFVIINMNCAIGHNCHIAKYCALAPGVNLAGFTKMEECVDVGIGVSTRQNIFIGANTIIGGQSMLIKDVLTGTKVAGIPAKKIEKK
jgi:sugar O-acyltransferase (sialic acid O-acetyltransferase NeuD family)